MNQLLMFSFAIALSSTFVSACDEGTPGTSPDATSEVTFDGSTGDGQPEAGPPDPTGPCLEVADSLSLGGVLLDESATRPLTVWNCGDEPLELTAAALLNNDGEPVASPNGAFALDATMFAGGPLTVDAGDFAQLPVTFSPTVMSPYGSDGVRIAETGYLQVEAQGTAAQVVKLKGYGVDAACTSPVIDTPTARLEPGETLKLDGAGSFGPTEIVRYSWTVDGPSENEAFLRPSMTAKNPTFKPIAEGFYKFSLTVEDAEGNVACAPDVATVHVAFSEKLEIVLTWETPEDPNPNDEGPEANVDLDLHLAHPNATGDGGSPWFHSFYDCFWFNASPNWGSFDPKVLDDPRLINDGGPTGREERLEMPTAEDGVSYRIGVHAWNDFGLGRSRATVKVYVRGELVHTASASVAQNDMWEVGSLAWPSGVVTPAVNSNGGPATAPIDNPIFPN